jgi:hypothetical protein
MKKILVLILSMNLIGCMSYEEETLAVQNSIENLQSKLPEGCTISYLGDAFISQSRSTMPVIVTKCYNLVTATSNYHGRHGKVTTNYVNIELEKLNEQANDLLAKKEILDIQKEILDKLTSEEKQILGME